MGRTVLAFNRVIGRLWEEWGKFRRALRKDDQQALDEMFAAAKYHAQAGAYLSHRLPMETVFMSILLEHQKAIKALKDRVKELEGKGEQG